ncbi:hypothetical protein TNCV_4595421 [Trichonephila clavipes]|uniref:Uncharacterized protein n=1 Tax=Trichonephila clavipes TaxID=2585209 RepID=A0A8X6WF15_TRICX|nr:hypothetical protein TNCV_4595421 [Trichonephila clavipes]
MATGSSLTHNYSRSQSEVLRDLHTVTPLPTADSRRCPYSILFVCATKVRLSKQQDEDHERYAAQRYPTHVQSVTYLANTQAKEEAVPAANPDRI